MTAGGLVYLMGPSGAGKDSLLAALRREAVEGLLVAHRYITRPATDSSENHVALSKAEFDSRCRGGLFAMNWMAHNHDYALGVEIDLWLDLGFAVVVNGSREYLPVAREKYRQELVPVCLRVAPETLRTRLQRRGRENAREIERRLLRASAYQRDLPPDCRFLDNDGALDDTVTALLALLREQAVLPDRVRRQTAVAPRPLSVA